MKVKKGTLARVRRFREQHPYRIDYTPSQAVEPMVEFFFNRYPGASKRAVLDGIVRYAYQRVSGNAG